MSTEKHEVNTELSQKLKLIFRRSLGRKHQVREEAQQEARRREERKEEPPAGEHVDPAAPLRGVLAKGDRYARRGYEYLKACNGRGVYRDFDSPCLDEIRELVREVAQFPGGPRENFNPTYTQRHPYPWKAHHLLPSSAFYYETKDRKPAFTYKQLRLILLSEYNINHGHNIILLPAQDWAVPVHSLLCHPSDHEAYTLRVMDEMREVSKKLQRTINKQEAHGELPIAAFEHLKELEDFFWEFIVKLSRAVVKARVAGVRYVGPDSKHVRYELEDGATQYGWGRLW